MAKLNNMRETENVSKGNSEDSLLVIYILRILKKYSSPDNPLSTQDVMDYLEKDYSILSMDYEELYNNNFDFKKLVELNNANSIH